jgi:rod shape-determining protein MreD
MKKIIVIILCSVALILQVFIKPLPDLLLLVLPIMLLYLINKEILLVICWILGLMRDVFSNLPFGLGCLMFVVTGYCLLNISRLIDFRNIFAISVSCFLMVLLFYMCEGILCASHIYPFAEILSRSLRVAILTTLILLICIIFINIVSKIKYMLSKNEE